MVETLRARSMGVAVPPEGPNPRSLSSGITSRDLSLPFFLSESLVPRSPSLPLATSLREDECVLRRDGATTDGEYPLEEVRSMRGASEAPAVEVRLLLLVVAEG